VLVLLEWLASFQELPASLVLPELQVSGAPLAAGPTSCWWGRARPFRQNESDWCHRLRWCQIGPANLRRSPYHPMVPFRPRRSFHRDGYASAIRADALVPAPPEIVELVPAAPEAVVRLR
jgi:hypothetical protein